MVMLPEDVAREMRELAKEVKERQAAAGNFTPKWNLTGKNATIPPGGDETVRLCPRWDILQSMIRDAQGVRPNPEYKVGRSFVIALEHWWQDGEGKWVQEYCPRTLRPDCTCPVCMAAASMMMSGSKEDKDWGKDIKANKVMIFNAVVGFPRKVGADGKADIRPLTLTDTLYSVVSDIMNGPEGQPQYARGDITNPRDGFDLLFHRPPSKSGQRWTVTPAAGQSALYGPDQAAAFQGWVERLVDLPEMLKRETKDEAGIFRSFFGRPPGDGELKGSRPVSVNGTAAAPPSSGAAPPAPALVDDPFFGPGQGVVSGAGTVPTPVAEKPNLPPQGPDDEFSPRSLVPAAPPQVPAQQQAPASKGAARPPRR